MEDLLPNIVAKLETDVQNEKVHKEEIRLHWLKWEQENELKNAAKMRIEDEVQKFKELLTTSEK